MVSAPPRGASIPDTPEVLASRLASIVATSDDAIVSKTLEGVVVTWNAAAERMFGWTAADMIGRPILTIIPAERQHEEPEILSRIERGERAEHYETIRQRKDGTTVEVSITVSPIVAPDGAVVGVSKIARDISARSAAERARRDDTHALELLNETARLISAELGLQAVVQAVCDAGTRLSNAAFGAFFYNVTDPAGESYMLYTLTGADPSAFGGIGMPRNTPVFAPTFTGQGVVRSDDITKDQRYGTMEPHHGLPRGHLPVRSYLAAPVRSRSGEVIGGLFFGHPDPARFDDRTERFVVAMASQAAFAIDNARLFEAAQKTALERKELLDAERHAREQAERASISRDQFLSNLSHELRTPLNAILGWAQLLGQGREEGLVKNGAAIIERNAQAQARLIDDLLDVTRIDAGKLRLTIETVDLCEEVKAAVETVIHSAESKGVSIQSVLGDVDGMVRGDATRLRQSVWNLLSNAVKFTPRGGRVHVSLLRAESHVEVRVTDTGQGIDPSFLPHVFERFRQADGTTTRAQGGLGLGLSIVKHIVQLHGGSVAAESPGVGLGASFTIKLPITPLLAPSHMSSPGLVGAPEAVLKGLKVLVVDDEEDSRALIEHLLVSRGAEVVACARVVDALEVFDGGGLDAIVSDIGMPERDGNDFLREVRRRESGTGRRTPAIALTAFARPEDRTRSLRAGFQSHMAKPVNIDELVALLDSLVQR